MTLPEEPTPSPGIPLEQAELLQTEVDRWATLSKLALDPALKRRWARRGVVAQDILSSLQSIPALERQARAQGMREAAKLAAVGCIGCPAAMVIELTADDLEQS